MKAHNNGNPKTELLNLLRSKGIHDEAVLAAMERVPREVFVSDAMRPMAYDNSPLPIDDRQTISQPYTVAFMTQEAGVTRGCRVMEIGTGSGYQAAVLAAMGARVFTVERHERLYTKSRQLLESLGYVVHSRHGDGTIGWSEHAPYDVILITAAAPDVPRTLASQLSVGGRMIVPVGETETQTLYRIIRTAEDSFKAEDLGPFRFVPLIGREGWNDK